MDYKKPSSTGIEIPLVSKRPAYRFFEMVPGLISWSLLLLAFVLSAWNAMVGAAYVLVVVVIMFIRGLITIRSAWLGYRMMAQAELVERIPTTAAPRQYRRLQQPRFSLSEGQPSL